MEIKSISQKIFRTSPNKTESNHNKVDNNHTNPFGVNFKGNIIQADVFDKSEKSGISFKGAEIAAKVANKGKIWTSAVVGSINNANEAMRRILNPVASFGRTIKQNALRVKDNAIAMKNKAVDLCKDFANTSLRIDIDAINYRKSKLNNMPVVELDPIFVRLEAAGA